MKPALIWDEWNTKHIDKHKVTKIEIEEAYAQELGRSESYAKREAIFGRTMKNRPVAIIVSYAKQPLPYVVSARDMSKKERRKYL